MILVLQCHKHYRGINLRVFVYTTYIPHTSYTCMYVHVYVYIHIRGTATLITSAARHSSERRWLLYARQRILDTTTTTRRRPFFFVAYVSSSAFSLLSCPHPTPSSSYSRVHDDKCAVLYPYVRISVLHSERRVRFMQNTF